jgi:hypothetical protein
MIAFRGIFLVRKTHPTMKPLGPIYLFKSLSCHTLPGLRPTGNELPAPPAVHHIKVIILFEKHEHAAKWNKMHETQIRKSGHMATVALTALVASLGGGYAVTVFAGSATAIIKDEVQAQIWYPEMFEGWVLTQHFTFRYEQFPGQHFYMEWMDVIQDQHGREKERHKHGQVHIKVGGPGGIPEKLVRNLMSRFPIHTVKFK